MIAALQGLCRILLAAEEASERCAVAVDLCDSASQRVGRVVSENGRICWAVARNQRRNIGEILAAEAGCDRQALEAAFSEAQSRAEPFGQTLIRLGLVTRETFQACLMHQTVEALLALADHWPADGKTRTTREGLPPRGYDPALTMSPLGVLDRCFETDAELQAERAGIPHSFRQLAEKLAAAIVFRHEPCEVGPLLPVAWEGKAATLALDAVLDVGRESLAVIRPAALEAADVHPYAVVVHGSGTGIICGRLGSHVSVYAVNDRFEHPRVMARLKLEHDSSVRSTPAES